MGKNLESMYFVSNGEGTQFVVNLAIGRLAALLLHFQSDVQEMNTHTGNYITKRSRKNRLCDHEHTEFVQSLWLTLIRQANKVGESKTAALSKQNKNESSFSVL